MIASPENTFSVRVEAIRWLAEDCHEFELVDPAGGPLPGGEPGSHIGIVLPNGIKRQYSLLESGEMLHRYRIGVKRSRTSRGGSSYMFETLRLGDILRVQQPRNNFPLEESAAHSVFIAGGIGITPIRCMIRRMEDLGRSWELHYATRNRDEAAFMNELQAKREVHLHFDDEAGTVLPISDIIRRSRPDAHLYCCGPAAMLAAFEEASGSAEWTDDRLHVEYFVQRYEAATDNGYVVELSRTGKEVVVRPGQTILEALRELGIETSYSCEEGICGACETRVLEGVPDHRDSILNEQERQANRTMFICCSGAKSDRLVLDL